MGKPKDNITILELGPGTGIMMLDILNVLKKNKEFAFSLAFSSLNSVLLVTTSFLWSINADKTSFKDINVGRILFSTIKLDTKRCYTQRCTASIKEVVHVSRVFYRRCIWLQGLQSKKNKINSDFRNEHPILIYHALLTAILYRAMHLSKPLILMFLKRQKIAFFYLLNHKRCKCRNHNLSQVHQQNYRTLKS